MLAKFMYVSILSTVAIFSFGSIAKAEFGYLTMAECKGTLDTPSEQGKIIRLNLLVEESGLERIYCGTTENQSLSAAIFLKDDNASEEYLIPGELTENTSGFEFARTMTWDGFAMTWRLALNSKQAGLTHGTLTMDSTEEGPTVTELECAVTTHMFECKK